MRRHVAKTFRSKSCHTKVEAPGSNKESGIGGCGTDPPHEYIEIHEYVEQVSLKTNGSVAERPLYNQDCKKAIWKSE